jgi:hypothetical protein
MEVFNASHSYFTVASGVGGNGAVESEDVLSKIFNKVSLPPEEKRGTIRLIIFVVKCPFEVPLQVFFIPMISTYNNTQNT